jgi:uncharacterized protein DUF6713
MNPDSLGAGLYVLALALLVTHQVDSAYWQEWELLHLPGGIQFNLVLNFVLAIVFLQGLILQVQQAPAGAWIALLLAASGLAAFLIHMVFLSRGDSRFRLPASVAVLFATLFVSLALAAVSIRDLAAA